MERWTNRVAAVTGASSGIGEAICKDLLAKGMVVVGLARRQERLEKLKASLPANQRARFHFVKCDVSVEDEVIKAFAQIEKTIGGVDVLVNNAAVMLHTRITDAGNSAELHAMLDINVLGVSWCTREFFLSLQKRKVDDGHVVIINAIVGHRIPVMPDSDFSFSMYAPSKHAITALTEVLRQEFLKKGTKTKVTSVSPGAVGTGIIPEELINSIPEFPMLRAEDVADAVVYCIGTPPNVQIHELTIKPIGEVF